jgi:hypothetical protein
MTSESCSSLTSASAPIPALLSNAILARCTTSAYLHDAYLTSFA